MLPFWEAVAHLKVPIYLHPRPALDQRVHEGHAQLESAQPGVSRAEDAAQSLMRLGAFYLGWHAATEGGDPVARFHLDNGARLERLDPLADLSAKGLRQSFGLMVNYLYDLDKVETHHEKFVQGEVAQSRQLTSLL